MDEKRRVTEVTGPPRSRFRNFTDPDAGHCPTCGQPWPPGVSRRVESMDCPKCGATAWRTWDARNGTRFYCPGCGWTSEPVWRAG